MWNDSYLRTVTCIRPGILGRSRAMKRLAIMAGLAAMAFSGALVSDSVLTGSFAKITTTTTNPGGQAPSGQQGSDREDGGWDTSAKNPSGKQPGGHNK